MPTHAGGPPPIELPPIQGGRSLTALGVSVTAHLLLGALAVGITRSEDAMEVARAERPVGQQVEMVYIPPPPNRRAAEPPTRQPAEPPSRQVPRPQVQRGEEMPEDVATRPEPPPPDLPLGELPAASAPEPADPERSAEPAKPTEVAAAPSMESEAWRIFGPSRAGVERLAGPIPARSWINDVTADRDNDCTPTRRPPSDPDTPPEMGVVTGRIFREGTRQPLPGAFLQILGTPYSTFADDQGDYELIFDQALVDDCRTQYVQISKDGFAPRRLILSLGRRVSNDVPLSRR